MVISSFKNKKTLFILVFLMTIFLVTTAQAAIYSTANLYNESKKVGRIINVHSGTTTFSALNEGSSRYVLTAAIRRSVAVFPDTQVYTQYLQPGHGVSKPVSLSPSTYYAYSEAGGKINATVSIKGTSIP